MNYDKLFSPLRLNGIMLRNRIIAAPIGTPENHKIISSINYGNTSLFDRSLGGAALVHIEGQNIFEKYELDVTKERINVAKQDGAKVAYELEFFDMVPDKNGFVLGPMNGTRFDGAKMRAFTKEDMNNYLKKISEQALNCKKIGIDALTIHVGHDSLGSQFLSPVWNQRTDEYGGSLENRCRFPVEVLKAIRTAVGTDYPLIVRISRELKVKETYTEDDMMFFIKLIENIVDMVNISCGMDEYYEANVYAVPTIFEPHLINAEFAKRVKENTKVKVCLVGAVMTPEECEEILEKGFADTLMVGRALLADPYWPKKVLTGHREDVVPCIRCMHCYHIATKHWNTQCSVNPRFRRELRFALNNQSQEYKKNIAVIGGGPSGMIAALEASKKGHDVTLYEKSNRLGGLLNPASLGELKVDLYRYLQYLLQQVQKSSIQVHLEHQPSIEELKQAQYDRLIIAVGSSPKPFKVKGSEYCMEATEAIEHPDNIDESGNVVFIGGGFVNCEVAIERARKGKPSIIIESTNSLASNANELYKISLKHHLSHNKDLIQVYFNESVLEISKQKIFLKNIQIPYSTVIVSIGRNPNREEAFQYYGVVSDTIMIGDCEKVGSLVDHVNLAYFVGNNS